jgi:hypothetical protein
MISDGRDGAPRRPRPRFPRLGGRNECGCANAFRRSGEAAPDAVARRCGRRSAPSPPKMVRTKKVGTLRCDVPAGASRFSASGIFGLPAGDRNAPDSGRRGAPSLPKRGRDIALRCPRWRSPLIASGSCPAEDRNAPDSGRRGAPSLPNMIWGKHLIAFFPPRAASFWVENMVTFP